MERTTRRKALRAGMLLAAGAVGAGAGLAGGLQQNAAPGAQPAPAGTESFTLHGRGWTSLVADRSPGQTPQRGDRVTTQGQILDGPGGAPVGEFFSAGFTVRHLAAVAEGLAGTLETHTFVLPGGTIVGTGAAGAHGTPSIFAVVGGTGRFFGVRGSYEAVQDVHDFGGDGSARFVFSLVR